MRRKPKILGYHLPYWMRPWLFGIGVGLVILAPIVGLLPGPGGIFLFAAGMALMLQNSRWAKRQYVRLKRRWPKMGRLSDWSLRRASHRRREEARKLARPKD